MLLGMQRVGIIWDVALGQRDDGKCCSLSSLREDLEPKQPLGNLFVASVEKQIRAEQAWKLQEAFQDRLYRFQDWLWAAEVMAASPNSSQVSFASSQKELQRFEVLRRQISDKLLSLESLNRKYHQLVRHTGPGLQLRSVVQEINRRWDDLQIRTAAIYKRLKYFVNQREEFESDRGTIRVSLAELDLRLTDVEHFSGGTLLEKMIQLQVNLIKEQTFQQDVQANAENVDHLLVRGEHLIQKSQPEDAEILEEELQDLSCFCQDIFRRVFHFRCRLVSMQLVFENKWLADRDSDLESDCFTEESLEFTGEDGTSPSPRPLALVRQSTPPKTGLHPQWLAPNFEGTADLEWDPSVDVGGSTSHDEEDSSYYSAITAVSQWEEPTRRCRAARRRRRLCCVLPLPWGSQEDYSSQKGFQEEKERINLTDSRIKKCNSESCQHLQDLPPGKAACCQVEPMGFDPKRIESWLGQSRPMKTVVQQETGQRATPDVSQPTRHFARPPQTSGQPRNQPKLQQQIKRDASTASSKAPPGQICNRKHVDSIARDKGYQETWLACNSVLSQKRPRTLPPTLNGAVLCSTVLLLLLLFLLAGASFLSLIDPLWLWTSGYTRSLHLQLKHINGPPPT